MTDEVEAWKELHKICVEDIGRLREILYWILNRHKMDNPPWRCACDICEACREGLGIE